ncbi:unnamed protein product, partial [Allacma fusca]
CIANRDGVKDKVYIDKQDLVFVEKEADIGNLVCIDNQVLIEDQVCTEDDFCIEELRVVTVSSVQTGL